MLKYYYKRFVLLGDYFGDEAEPKSVETTMLLLSASALIKQASNNKHSSLVSSKKSSETEAVPRCVVGLKQIDVSPESSSSCLLNEKLLPPALREYLERQSVSQTEKANVVDIIRGDDDSHVCRGVSGRWFQPEEAFQSVLSDLSRFLSESLDTRPSLSEEHGEDTLFKRCESLFAELNGDQNCVPFLYKRVVGFFASSSFIKRAADRYEACLFNRVSSFTLEVIYRLLTNYFQNGDTNGYVFF